MNELTEEQKTEYFRRSYTAADGLWFMMVEERLGFEQALQIDEAVWKVLPKIQARTMKGMMHLAGRPCRSGGGPVRPVWLWRASTLSWKGGRAALP